MNEHIQILDCTLRDGGYCNNWEFGYNNQKRIIAGLVEANIDIIECGILAEGDYNPNISRFNNIEKTMNFIPTNRKDKLFVLLMNYGEYNVEYLPKHMECGIHGTRVAFHKKDMHNALELIKKIAEKNYKIFMQPMVTSSYSEEEYRFLLHEVNKISPYAFYVVDSFGSMKGEKLDFYLKIVDAELQENVRVGFHSHNNLQLAYSNAQFFVENNEKRNIIIDCCIMGMGRGAGNLNTELFLDYMNEIQGIRYRVEPILRIIDEIINVFYKKKYWGYSLPNYLSAKHNLHPNYAMHFADKNTLTITMMDEVLSLIESGRKNCFDKDYAEDLYISYMSTKSDGCAVSKDLTDIFAQKKVLIIAPGKSIDFEREKIREFVNNKDIISVCVNFDYSEINTDYVFVSNRKRFEELVDVQSDRLIITTNIETEMNCLKVDYLSVLCDEKYVRDNAAMMLIKLLVLSHVKSIYLAGLDGYSHEMFENYSRESTVLVTSNEAIDCINNGMNKLMQSFSNEVSVEFVTTEKNIRRS